MSTTVAVPPSTHPSGSVGSGAGVLVPPDELADPGPVPLAAVPPGGPAVPVPPPAEPAEPDTAAPPLGAPFPDEHPVSTTTADNTATSPPSKRDEVGGAPQHATARGAVDAEIAAWE